VGITAGSREVPGGNACDKRHTYFIIIIIIIIIINLFVLLPWKMLGDWLFNFLAGGNLNEDIE